MIQPPPKEVPLAGELALLERMKVFNHDAVHAVDGLMRDAELSALAGDYSANLKKREVDLGFNLFAIISELYYRENFHSDVLQAIIDPKGKHREKDAFLHLFLEFIRSHGAAINSSDYSNAQVIREKDRIDLLIKDEDSKKAIIIENKINNAGD